MSNYPPLRLPVLAGLALIRDQLSADPEFLTHPECPYDNEVRAILTDLLATKVVEKVVEREVPVTGARGRPTKDVRLDDEDQKKVLEEIKKTLDQLNSMTADATLQTGERIQIAKTKTGLLDQLLKMMERWNTVTRTEQFKESVIGILNDLVDEKDREIFLSRINAFR